MVLSKVNQAHYQQWKLEPVIEAKNVISQFLQIEDTRQKGFLASGQSDSDLVDCLVPHKSNSFTQEKNMNTVCNSNRFLKKISQQNLVLKL